MARASPVFVCNACSGETVKWQGQCPACGEWNSLEQRVPVTARQRARPLDAAAPRRLGTAVEAIGKRLASGHVELDRVMGGGIEPGSATLLGGDPGIGKSTLLLQVAGHVGGTNPVLY